jgi:hypothetical protein
MHGKGMIASNGHEMQGIWEEGVCKQTIDADFDTLKGLEMGVSLSERLQCVCRGKSMLAFVCLCVVVRLYVHFAQQLTAGSRLHCLLLY